MNIKNAWLTFISVNWNKGKDKKYKCYWKDNSIDILTLSELYFNFSKTSELKIYYDWKLLKRNNYEWYC
ncbi:hypothetical protein MSROBK_024110 [Spiroplasma poulsonii]|uniref:Uncharacterized protein n=1 Tax=Spiroplasma poulsonii TaxID=2138 RepID=A0A2P6FG54_9MOLU|nr:hypothetical protein MSROBK_024110 [Spiroplasma poulsonii]PQM32447.1 hypothetical protein SMSRO_SF023680 [Spiroplasma poulsonii]PWF95113.1 hypothetical protein SMSE_05380 [Spiroplasma poulsonii]PWF97906.1 hypothetical protein SMH99_04560 [Spiroplasma poulsonii]